MSCDEFVAHADDIVDIQLSGGVLDIDKVIQLVLRDFRTGRLGRFTLDEPSENN